MVWAHLMDAVTKQLSKDVGLTLLMYLKSVSLLYL